MNVTSQEIDGFASFAHETIAKTSEEMSFDDLVILWQSLRDRDEINAAIREGIADIDAGRHRPADEVFADLVKKHQLPIE